MPTLTNVVMSVDTTLPAGQRYISLKEGDFDGGTGEGDFISGNGPDFIPVYDTLKRTASSVQVRLTEGTGGASDTYTITLRINAKVKIFTENHTRYHSPIPLPIKHIDQSIEVDSHISTIEIIAVAGETVTWKEDFQFIHNIEVDGIAGASGTCGDFNILIK